MTTIFNHVRSTIYINEKPAAGEGRIKMHVKAKLDLFEIHFEMFYHNLTAVVNDAGLELIDAGRPAQKLSVEIITNDHRNFRFELNYMERHTVLREVLGPAWHRHNGWTGIRMVLT